MKSTIEKLKALSDVARDKFPSLDINDYCVLHEVFEAGVYVSDTGQDFMEFLNSLGYPAICKFERHFTLEYGDRGLCTDFNSEADCLHVVNDIMYRASDDPEKFPEFFETILED